MSDYLWDRSGHPDPEIQQLEETLGVLRGRPPLPILPVAPDRVRFRRWFRLAAAAGIAAALALAVWMGGRRSPQWSVSGLSGTRSLAVGERVETDGSSHARVSVGGIASIDVDPNSSLQLVRTGPSEHRLALQRGRVSARISARPKLFFIDTPSAVTIDLGCAYTLEVDREGSSIVAVTHGMVSIESHGRGSFIPAGAACVARMGSGPGLPIFQDAAPEFAQAAKAWEVQPKPEELTKILRDARPRDVLTLWHMVPLTAGADRAAVVERAVAFCPPPPTTSRQAILEARRDALDGWWQVIRRRFQ